MSEISSSSRAMGAGPLPRTSSGVRFGSTIETQSQISRTGSLSAEALSAVRGRNGSSGPGGRTASLLEGSPATPRDIPTRARSGSRYVRKVDELAVRKGKFRIFASSPSIGVDAEMMGDVVQLLPDVSEIKFARHSADGANSGIVITLSPRHLCVRQLYNTSNTNKSKLEGLTLNIEDVATIYDSSVDDNVVFVRSKGSIKNLGRKDLEQRLLAFESRTDREHFIAHLFTLCQSYRRRDSDEDAIQIVTWPGKLRDVDDVRSCLNSDKRTAEGGGSVPSAGEDGGGNADELLESTSQDYLEISQQRKGLCAKIAQNGDKIVHFSCACQSAKNKHDVLVLTDRAIYVGKVRTDKVKHVIPYHAITGVAVDLASEAGVLLQFDFSEVQIRGDLFLDLARPHLRQTMLKVLTRLYEELVVAQLKVDEVDDAFWAKRGFIECQLVRLVHAFEMKRHDDEEGPSEQERQSAMWLRWALKYQPHVVLGVIGHCRFADSERGFLSRSMLALAKQLSVSEIFIRCCVQYELLGYVTPAGAPITAPALLTAGSIPREKGFRPESVSVPNLILDEYVLGPTEQYVQLLLGQTLEEFVAEPRTADEELTTAHDLCPWIDGVLSQLFGIGRSPDAMPDALKVVVALIHEVWRDFESVHRRFNRETSKADVFPVSTQSTPSTHHLAPEGRDNSTGKGSQSSTDGAKPLGAGASRTTTATTKLDPHEPYKSIGSFLMAKLLLPALKDPQGFGLIASTLTEQQMRNMSRISTALESIATFKTIQAIRLQVDDLADYCVEQQRKMLDFLKDIVLTGYTNAPPKPDPITLQTMEGAGHALGLSTSLSAGSPRHHRSVLGDKELECPDSTIRLLCSVNKVLGHEAAQLMVSGWVGGQLSGECAAGNSTISFASLEANGSSARVQRTMSLASEADSTTSKPLPFVPGGKPPSATTRSSTVLDDDDDDVGPPDMGRRRATARPEPVEDFVVERSKAYIQLKHELEKLKSETELMRHDMRQALTKLQASESNATYFQELAGHLKTELMAERGIESDSELSDTEVFKLTGTKRREARRSVSIAVPTGGEGGKITSKKKKAKVKIGSSSDSSSDSTSDGGDDDGDRSVSPSAAGGGSPSLGPKRTLSASSMPQPQHSALKNPLMDAPIRLGAPFGSNARTSTQPSTAQLYQRSLASGQGGKRPWGCPLESYALNPTRSVSLSAAFAPHLPPPAQPK